MADKKIVKLLDLLISELGFCAFLTFWIIECRQLRICNASLFTNGRKKDKWIDEQTEK